MAGWKEQATFVDEPPAQPVSKGWKDQAQFVDEPATELEDDGWKEQATFVDEPEPAEPEPEKPTGPPEPSREELDRMSRTARMMGDLDTAQEIDAMIESQPEPEGGEEPGWWQRAMEVNTAVRDKTREVVGDFGEYITGGDEDADWMEKAWNFATFIPRETAAMAVNFGTGAKQVAGMSGAGLLERIEQGGLSLAHTQAMFDAHERRYGVPHPAAKRSQIAGSSDPRRTPEVEREMQDFLEQNAEVFSDPDYDPTAGVGPKDYAFERILERAESDYSDQDLVGKGLKFSQEMFRDWAEYQLPEDHWAHRDNIVQGAFMQGLGSMGTFMLSFGLGGPTGGIAAAGGMGAHDFQQDALQNLGDEELSEMDKETVESATKVGVAMGTSQIAPIASMFNRLKKPLEKLSGRKGFVRELGEATLVGVQEATLEGFYEFAKNATANEFEYDPERSHWENVKEAAGMGGAVGFTATLIMRGMLRGKGPNSPTIDFGEGEGADTDPAIKRLTERERKAYEKYEKAQGPTKKFRAFQDWMKVRRERNRLENPDQETDDQPLLEGPESGVAPVEADIQLDEGMASSGETNLLDPEGQQQTEPETPDLAQATFTPLQAARELPPEPAADAQPEDYRPVVDENADPAQSTTFAETMRTEIDGLPAAFGMAFPGNLKIDPETYQYKQTDDPEGRTDRFTGDEKWDPSSAGTIIIHRREDGDYIADGHQRAGLARSRRAAGENPSNLFSQAIILNEADGWTPQNVRMVAALKNVREETGTAIDAAKLLREGGQGVVDALGDSINPKRAIWRDAQGLAGLADPIFQEVVNGVVPTDRGAIIGQHVTDPAKQRAALQYFQENPPSTQYEAEIIARDIDRLEAQEQTQGGLDFGDAVANVPIKERAKILDAARKLMNTRKKVFKQLVKDQAMIEGEAGNVLDEQGNVKIAQDAENVMAVLNRMVDTSPELNEVLNNAAAQLANGETTAADAARELVSRSEEFAASVLRGREDREGEREPAGPVEPGQREEQEAPGAVRPEADESTQESLIPDAQAERTEAQETTEPEAQAPTEAAESRPTRRTGRTYRLVDSLNRRQARTLAENRDSRLGVVMGELDSVIRAAEARMRRKGQNLDDYDENGILKFEASQREKFSQEASYIRAAEDLAGRVLDHHRERKGDIEFPERDPETGDGFVWPEGDPETMWSDDVMDLMLLIDNAMEQGFPIDTVEEPVDYDRGSNTERMAPDDVFPEPDRTVNIDKRAGDDYIPLSAAESRLESWKETATEIGESADNSNKVIISLFDYTGAWSQPWEDAGYQVLRYDIKTNQDVLIHDWLWNRVEELRDSGMEIYGVLSACPCTTFAGSGARWWKERHDVESKEMLEKTFGSWGVASGAESAVEYNRMLVDATRQMIEVANPTGFHVLENPIGRITEQTDLPDPTARFQPHNFGNPYTKRTQLWGDFRPDLPLANVDPTEGSKMQSKLRGDDPLGKEERSRTPEGFAYSFFMANDPDARQSGVEAAAGDVAGDTGWTPPEGGMTREQIRQRASEDAFSPGIPNATEAAWMWETDPVAYMQGRILNDLKPEKYGGRMTLERLGANAGVPQESGTFDSYPERLQEALDGLVDDGLIEKHRGAYRLPGQEDTRKTRGKKSARKKSAKKKSARKPRTEETTDATQESTQERPEAEGRPAARPERPERPASPEGGRAGGGTTGTVGGRSPGPEGVRPPLRVASEELIPEPRGIIGNDTYQGELDDGQILASNLALERFEDGGRGFMLADGTGTGKTRQILAVADQYRRRTGKKVLIVTENETVIAGSFTSDSRAMGIDLNDFEVTTYSQLGKQKSGLDSYGVAIFDEAHNLKNLSTDKATAATNVSADHRMFATATPLDQITGAVYFMSEITGRKPQDVYNSLGLVVRTDDRGKKPKKYVQLREGYQWGDVMKALVSLRDEAIRSGAMIRREYPFFGEITTQEMRLTPEQLKEQDQIFDYWEAQIAEAKGPKAKGNRAGQRTMELARWTEAQKVDEAVAAVERELADGRRVILVAEGVNETTIKGLDGKQVPGLITSVKQRLADKGIEVGEIYGQNKRRRERAVDAFQDGEVRVVLATPKSGGTGINLDDVRGDAPRSMVIVTQNWSGSIFDQIMGRVSRRNTASPARIVNLAATNAESDIRKGQILRQKLQTLRAVQHGKPVDTGAVATDVPGYGDQQSGLLSDEPTQTQQDLEKRRLETEERLGGRSSADMLEGDGELFAGPRPEQGDVFDEVRTNQDKGWVEFFGLIHSDHVGEVNPGREPLPAVRSIIESDKGQLPANIRLEGIDWISGPENSQLVEVMGAAVSDLVDSGFPLSVVESLDGFMYAQSQDTTGRAGFYWRSQPGVGANNQIMTYLAENPGDVEAQQIFRLMMAHEMGHRIDRGESGESLAETSPLFDMEISPDGREIALGDVIHEMYVAYLRGTEGLTEMLRYPFESFDDARVKGMVGPDLIDWTKREAFAQIAALYYTRPDALSQAAPRAWQMMEEINNAYSDAARTFRGARAFRNAVPAVRGALRVSEAGQPGSNNVERADQRTDRAGTGGRRSARRVARGERGRDDGDAGPVDEIRPDSDGRSRKERRENLEDLYEAMERAGLARSRKPIREWISDLQDVTWKAVRDRHRAFNDSLIQGTLDRFHGIKRAEERHLGNLPTEQSGYVAARLSTGVASIMRSVMLHGAPVWRDGIIQQVDESQGLLQILSPVKSDLNTFLGWMVGRRARRLASEGRENLFEGRHIEALIRAGENSPVFDQFGEVADNLEAFKHRVLDVAEQSGLIDPEARAVWDHAEYVPFYRVSPENEGRPGPSSRDSLSGQSSGIRNLRGGTERLNDPLENMLMNFTHLLDAAVKNMAIVKVKENLGSEGILEKVGMVMKSELIPMDQVKKILKEQGIDPDTLPEDALKGIRKMWAITPPAKPDVVRVMEGGRANYYRVLDPLLLRALTAIRDPSLNHPIVNTMRGFKRILTRGVTADPAFMARNFLRDALHAWVISEDHFRLGVDSIRGVTKTLTETGGSIDMMFAGGSFLGGYVNATDPKQTSRAIRVALRERGYSASARDKFLATVVDTPLRLWEMYTHIGDAVENASREAVYEAAMKAGKSKATAVFEAKDLMDYSMRGDWAMVQFLTDVIPFLNARAQGLYKLSRSAHNAPERVMARGSLITLFALAILALNKDDERYEQLQDWDKDTYWHIFLPSTFVGDEASHIRIPKPFEIGVLFGTIPERIALNMMEEDDNEKTFERFIWAIRQTFAFDPIPQAFGPALELAMNRNRFLDMPIEGMGDEGRLPAARYDERTSATMRALGRITGPAVGMSPKQLEHLWRGYTGQMGMYVLDVADVASRAAMDMPPRPKWRIDEYPVIRSFLRAEPAWSSQYTTELYDLHREVDQIYRTIRHYERTGEEEKALELLEENTDKLDVRDDLRDAVDENSKISKEMERIMRSKDMTPEEKREAIDELIALRNDNSRTTMKSITEFFDSLEEE